MAMVNTIKLLTIAIGLSYSSIALALLNQTQSDLSVLEDALETKLEEDRSFLATAFPMLLATPVHHWQESRSDFSTQVGATLKRAFGDDATIINCPDCDTWRLYVQNDQNLTINNGELSLSELSALKKMPKYGEAKSLATIRETPAGVEMRVTNLTDGRIQFFYLADASKTIDEATPYLNYNRERDRRINRVSLSSVSVNVGLYPASIVQVELLEQWGAYNQFVSGVGLSLIGPVAGVGLVHHQLDLFPAYPGFHVSGAIYYPAIEAIANSISDETNVTGGLVLQAMAHYTFANRFGVFASINTDGEFTLGVSF